MADIDPDWYGSVSVIEVYLLPSLEGVTPS